MSISGYWVPFLWLFLGTANDMQSIVSWRLEISKAGIGLLFISLRRGKKAAPAIFQLTVHNWPHTIQVASQGKRMNTLGFPEPPKIEPGH